MVKDTITKDMTIGEVVNKHPEAASVMLSYGLHCIGCAVNPYESIENGCLGHGIDEDTINKLVDDINKVVKESSHKENRKSVLVTKEAIDKFKEFMKEDHKEGFGVRLSVYGSGCGGYQYSLDFAERPNSEEEVFEDNEIKVFIDRSVADLVKGVEIDYVDNEKGSGFRIENPNAKTGECGCAE